MSRVITFSRQFPAYHPKAGQPTYFVEKILMQLGVDFTSNEYYYDLIDLNSQNIDNSKLGISDTGRFQRSLDTSGDEYKLHTIRSGHRWKAGDWFSPRIWSGKPYQSPQIIFAPDIQVKKVWDFKIIGPQKIRIENTDGWDVIRAVSENDGLSLSDFISWFKYPAPFDGQIIAWDENINY